MGPVTGCVDLLFFTFCRSFQLFFSGSFLFQKEVEMSLTFLDINNKHTIVTFSSQFQFDVLAQKRWFQVFNRKLLNLIPIEKPTPCHIWIEVEKPTNLTITFSPRTLNAKGQLV